jgi:hypothetical protein
MADYIRPTLAAPPALSGAYQAGFSPHLSWLFLQPNNSHCFTSSAHPAPRIGASPKFMRREHYGNFSVADSAASTSAGAAANTSAKRRSASRCPSSVRMTDFAFPTGSEMKPLLCSRSIASQSNPFPYATTVMQTEQEQRENCRVHALGIDLHGHNLPNATSDARILQQASIAQQA